MLLVNKNITVVGMGLTGLASANFLVSKKARVTLIDSKPLSKLEKDVRSLNPQIRTLFE
jgi:UDP-N-acetylmuramoylalanine-D-glutamate ligase